MNKLLFTAMFYAIIISANGQPYNALSVTDYKRAESFLAYNTQRLVDHASLTPNWLPGDRFGIVR